MQILYMEGVCERCWLLLSIGVIVLVWQYGGGVAAAGARGGG